MKGQRKVRMVESNTSTASQELKQALIRVATDREKRLAEIDAFLLRNPGTDNFGSTEPDTLRSHFDWMHEELRARGAEVGRLIDDAKEREGYIEACVRDVEMHDNEAFHQKQLREAAEKEVGGLRKALEDAPHAVSCKSRAVIDDTPWDEFTYPVCRSINGCGHCEKCEWKMTRPDFRKFPCNCWKSTIALEAPATKGKPNE